MFYPAEWRTTAPDGCVPAAGVPSDPCLSLLVLGFIDPGAVRTILTMLPAFRSQPQSHLRSSRSESLNRNRLPRGNRSASTIPGIAASDNVTSGHIFRAVQMSSSNRQLWT